MTIIEFSVIHDGYRNSDMSIRPFSDCMKEPSLRGGAADAAIQKVFTGTVWRCWIATPHPRLAMTGQLISFLQSPGIVVNYGKVNKYNSGLKTHARALRQSMTDAEQTLWSRLRRKQIFGVRFYRQKPLGCYIVDFYAPGAKLVIELGGSQHFEQEHAQRDAVRDSYLQGLHLQVLRFNNLQALQELEAVLGEISRVVNERVNPYLGQKANPPQPPFCKGGSENVSVLDGSKNVSVFRGSENVPALEGSENIPALEGSENIPALEGSENVPPFAKWGLGGIYGLSDSPAKPGKTDTAK